MATVAGLFNTEQEAERGIQALRNSGIEASNIGVVAQDRARMDSLSASTGAETGAAAVSGAVGGAVLGGGLGLILAAIGAVAIPVVGPIIAAGPLVAALTGAGVGAATGGLVGALTEAGIPHEEAQVYHTGVERGGILVTALTQNGQEHTARAIMQQYGSLEPTNARTTFERDPNYRLGQTQSSQSAVAGTVAGDIQPTTAEKVISTGNSSVARNATDANIGAENAVEGAGIYSRNDTEDIVRTTSGNIRSETERGSTTADDVMYEGIEEADTLYKRQNIGL